MEKKYQLPKEFLDKWVEALRATDLKQGFTQYFNRRKKCYCGMGIGYLSNGYSFTKDGEHIAENKNVISGDLFWQMVSLNDGQRLTFAQQADWLIANVEPI